MHRQKKKLPVQIFLRSNLQKQEIVLEYRGVAQTIARKGGKSGLHRAGCRITSGGGDSKTSAIEKKQPGNLWLPGDGGMAG